jgi:hypothetical protein
MGLLDMIGPVMVGPSSSYTAGACRLALIARYLLGDLIIHFTSRGDSDSTAGVSLERLWLRPFTHEARTKPGSLGLGSWAAKASPT